MYFHSDNHRDHTLLKLSLTALYILLAYDILALLGGYFILQKNPVAFGNSLVRNIVFLIAIADMAAIYFIKKAMLGKIIKNHEANTEKDVLAYKQMLKITIMITAMCVSIATYGLILIVLGEKFEILMLFIALSLISYQFFRLRSRDFPDVYGCENEQT